MSDAPVIPSVRELLADIYTYEMAEAFPDVAAPFAPFGFLAMLQLRQPKQKSKGGIIIPDEAKDTERFRTQATLVRALGPMCFKDRRDGSEWREGAWYGPGDFIRCPMYGGDRFEVKYGPKADDKVTFVFIKEADALAKVLGNPLEIEHS